MHGFYADGQSFIEAGLQAGAKTWVLQLVDLGYDVWLGNARGTRYSAEKTSGSDSD